MLSGLKIATRLKATLGMLGLLLVGLAALALWQMQMMRTSTYEITSNWLPSVEVINTMNTNTSDFRILELQHVLATDAGEMSALEKKMDELLALFEKNRTAYVKIISSDKEQKIYDSFAADWKLYMEMHQKLLGISRNNETEKATALLKSESRTVYDRFSDTLVKLIELNHDGSVVESEASERAFTTARTAITVSVAIGLVLAVAAGLWLVRSITGPLAVAVATADRVAGGDLSGTIDTRSEDEAGQVLRALARMQENLSKVVFGVRQGSESVATASAQIAQGNQDLSQRTEEQASALQQTAATMHELGETVRHNADNARQANQLAQSATGIAAKGGEVVGQVVGTMKGINDSSRKIADIITVIDGIAFQTNILALNAAVEAARAGEQGRGFAVVASEVRTLAQRSAAAAKEIKTLITSSVEQVEQGSALVDQAGQTMGEIVGSIKRVSDIVAEITSASAEQSTGVGQVGEAVSQMDQVTQQNAALVEESAAAAASLQQQAEQLVKTVAVFKFDQHGGHAASSIAGAGFSGAERRGPQRATNVSRPKFGAKSSPSPETSAAAEPQKTGTDNWESF